MILEINTGAGFDPVACIIGYNESEDAELLGTTTRQNGGWKTSLPIIQGKQITVQAVVPTDQALVSYNDLKTLKRDKTSFTYRIDDETGTAIISDISLEGKDDTDLAFNLTMQVQGEPTITP